MTAISLTEMLFGRLDVVEDLRLSFPITGFFFYLVFMVPRPFFFFSLGPGDFAWAKDLLESKSNAWIQEIFL